jgi:hypothetical protein
MDKRMMQIVDMTGYGILVDMIEQEIRDLSGRRPDMIPYYDTVVGILVHLKCDLRSYERRVDTIRENLYFEISRYVRNNPFRILRILVDIGFNNNHTDIARRIERAIAEIDTL